MFESEKNQDKFFPNFFWIIEFLRSFLKLNFFIMHSAVADPSKTVPGKSLLKFNNRDDQSTTLSILVEKLELPITAKCSKVRPKNEA